MCGKEEEIFTRRVKSFINAVCAKIISKNKTGGSKITGTFCTSGTGESKSSSHTGERLKVPEQARLGETNHASLVCYLEEKPLRTINYYLV